MTPTRAVRSFTFVSTFDTVPPGWLETTGRSLGRTGRRWKRIVPMVPWSMMSQAPRTGHLHRSPEVRLVPQAVPGPAPGRAQLQRQVGPAQEQHLPVPARHLDSGRGPGPVGVDTAPVTSSLRAVPDEAADPTARRDHVHRQELGVAARPPPPPAAGRRGCSPPPHRACTRPAAPTATSAGGCRAGWSPRPGPGPAGRRRAAASGSPPPRPGSVPGRAAAPPGWPPCRRGPTPRRARSPPRA